MEGQILFVAKNWIINCKSFSKGAKTYYTPLLAIVDKYGILISQWAWLCEALMEVLNNVQHLANTFFMFHSSRSKRRPDLFGELDIFLFLLKQWIALCFFISQQTTKHSLVCAKGTLLMLSHIDSYKVCNSEKIYISYKTSPGCLKAKTH